MCPALRERVTGCHLLCHPCWKWRGVYKEQKQKTCCVTSNRNGKHILYLVTHFDIQNPIGLSERYAAWIKVLEQLATSSFRWTHSLRLTVTEIDGLLYCCDLGLTVNESIASSSYTPVDRFQFRLRAFCAGGVKKKKKDCLSHLPKMKLSCEMKSLLTRWSGNFEILDILSYHDFIPAKRWKTVKSQLQWNKPDATYIPTGDFFLFFFLSFF